MTFSEISYIRPDQDESLNQLSALQKRLEIGRASCRERV